MKKRSEETQTLRAGCSKAERKIFASPQTPFPGPRDSQSATQFGEDRCTQCRVIVVTDSQTNTRTNRQDRLQYTAPQLSAQCKNKCAVDGRR